MVALIGHECLCVRGVPTAKILTFLADEVGTKFAAKRIMNRLRFIAIFGGCMAFLACGDSDGVEMPTVEQGVFGHSQDFVAEPGGGLEPASGFSVAAFAGKLDAQGKPQGDPIGTDGPTTASGLYQLELAAGEYSLCFQKGPFDSSNPSCCITRSVGQGVIEQDLTCDLGCFWVDENGKELQGSADCSLF